MENEYDKLIQTTTVNVLIQAKIRRYAEPGLEKIQKMKSSSMFWEVERLKN